MQRNIDRPVVFLLDFKHIQILAQAHSRPEAMSKSFVPGRNKTKANTDTAVFRAQKEKPDNPAFYVSELNIE